jgi:hypothetical protein
MLAHSPWFRKCGKAKHPVCFPKADREKPLRSRFSQPSGVENRRSSGSLPVVCIRAAFAERASVRFDMALFPVPAHRTGQAHLAHPALGERFTVLPTESCWSE